MQVNAPRLLRSACASVVALVAVIGIIVVRVNAANYTANFLSAANWTATGVWACSSGAPPDTCGTYPGQFALSSAGITDHASLTSSSGAVMTANSTIANPVQLTLGGAALDIPTGGQLTLTGASAIGPGSTGAQNVLSISGGTLTNAGTLAATSTGFNSILNLNGGTLNGPGTTSFTGASAIFNITGSQGPMTIDQQTISAGGTLNQSNSANALTLGNGATINNTANYNANTSANTLFGGGTAPLIFNNAVFSSAVSAASFTIGASVPFTNARTVTFTGNSSTFRFLGGSGPGGHVNAAWSLGTGNTANFGGAHLFTGSQSFTGTTSLLDILAGGSWTLSMSAPTSIGAGLNLNNDGTLGFAGARQVVTISGGTYAQSATGNFAPRLGIGGTAAGGADSVTVIGGGTLGGTLAPVLAYTPAIGDTFTVMSCTPCTGTFTYTPVTFPG